MALPAIVTNTVTSLLDIWRRRQEEILNTLTPELLTEYRQLSAALTVCQKTIDEMIERDCNLIVPPDRVDLTIPGKVTTVSFIGNRPEWADMAITWFGENKITVYFHQEIITQIQANAWNEASRKIWTDAIERAGGPPCVIFQSEAGSILAVAKPDGIEALKEIVAKFNEQSRVWSYSRVPFSEHKQNLIAFLKNVETATRSEMSVAARIPEGSLSQVLREKEFEQVERGRWKLKK